MCQILYIVFHQLQLILSLNSLWIHKFVFVFLSSHTACVSYFLKIIIRKTVFHFPFPICRRSGWGFWAWTQMEDSLTTFSSLILKYLQGTAWLFFSCLPQVVRKQPIMCLHWIFSCRQCLRGSAWTFLSNSRWYCELWQAFLSFSPKLNLEKKHLGQTVF